MTTSSAAPDHRLWGKDKGLAKPYPLIWHLLDTAAIAGCLWDHHLTSRQRSVVCEALQVEPTHARLLVMFWAGLHDVGKATPGFQRKALRAFAALQADEAYADSGDKNLGHATASQYAVVKPLLGLGYWQQKGLWQYGSAWRVAQLLGAHHGRFCEITERGQQAEAATNMKLGGNGWRRQRDSLFRTVHEVVGSPAPPVDGDVAISPQAAAIILGAIVVADWLASQEHFISTQQRRHDAVANAIVPSAHFLSTVQAADDVLAEAGLGRAHVAELGFVPSFGFPPNPLQQSIVDEFVGSVTGAGLLVVTAATGDGKTEAGLTAARALAAVSGADGLYFALPTMAAADQMYWRVAEFIARIAHGPTPVTLLHSMSWLNPEYVRRREAGVAGDVVVVTEDMAEAVLASVWLRGRLRGLLAPFAVGTIDQALLAVLAVRHNLLRVFGLAGKVLIVDEAHAYDAYMQALLGRLITWLGALRCPVVLLSATLPSKVTARLAEAYARGAGRREFDSSEHRVQYPGWLFVPADPTEQPLTVSDQAQRAIAGHRTAKLEVDVRRVLHVRDTSSDLMAQPNERLAVIRDLLGPLRTEDGCVAVVCNTVEDAQRTFLALADWRAAGVELHLLHSRFPAKIREEITKRIVSGLGRDGVRRPRASIVVGTQIIEQSLDLDFDLVVSDLAPIAQLLQRAGRCHRHTREDRPGWVGHPRLVVLDPCDKNGTYVKPVHWGDVYAAYLLGATHELLVARAGRPVQIPGDVQDLVEQVYVNGAGGQSFADDFDKMLAEEWAQRDIAGFVVIPPPSKLSDFVAFSRKDVEEADAVTRLGVDSVRVVCCYVDGQGVRWLEPECRRKLPDRGSGKRGRFTEDEVRLILQESIPIRAAEVKDRGEEHAVPKRWEDNAWLRDLVLLPHTVTPSGIEPLGGRHVLVLDPPLGLVRDGRPWPD